MRSPNSGSCFSIFLGSCDAVPNIPSARIGWRLHIRKLKRVWLVLADESMGETRYVSATSPQRQYHVSTASAPPAVAAPLAPPAPSAPPPKRQRRQEAAAPGGAANIKREPIPLLGGSAAEASGLGGVAWRPESGGQGQAGAAALCAEGGGRGGGGAERSGGWAGGSGGAEPRADRDPGEPYYRGVYKAGKRWVAKISPGANGERILQLGLFHSREAAARAWRVIRWRLRPAPLHPALIPLILYILPPHCSESR